MRPLVVVLLYGGVMLAVTAAAQRTQVRELSFRNVPMQKNERIAAIQIDVTGATFSKVSIPYDWGVDITPPVANSSTLKATGQHSTAFLLPNQLQKFVTLTYYASTDPPFAVKASVVLYSDNGKTVSQRLIDLPKQCIVLQ